MGEAIRRPELRDGLLSGAAAGVLPLVAGGLLWRDRRSRPWPIAGILVVVASLAAMRRDGGAPGEDAVAMFLLGLAGLLPLPWRVPALGPGAAALALALPPSLPGWAAPFVAVVAVVGGVTAPLVDERGGPGVGPVLLAGSALGAWACVPDVEQVAVVAGAAVAVALVSLVIPLRLGQPGAAAATGLVLSAAASGSTGRPAALIGVAAGLGVLVVGVVALPVRITGWTSAAAVAGQVALVATASRGAGMRASPSASAALAGTVLLLAAGVAATAARSRSPARDRPLEETHERGGLGVESGLRNREEREDEHHQHQGEGDGDDHRKDRTQRHEA